MTDEVELTPEQMVETNYIETIKEIKANSVPREAYEKLFNQNKELIGALVNNNPQETAESEVIMSDKQINELREDLFNRENLNIDFVTKALKLREEVMKKDGVDIFCPYGHNIAPTYEDTQAAERVAQVFQQCIDYAQGDNQVFTNELMRRTNDVKFKR